MLVDLQTFLAGVAAQELDLRIRELLTCQKRQHLRAEQMRVDRSAQSGGLTVVLDDLLHPANRVRSAPLRLEQIHLFWMGREVSPEHHVSGRWSCPPRCRAGIQRLWALAAGGSGGRYALPGGTFWVRCWRSLESVTLDGLWPCHGPQNAMFRSIAPRIPVPVQRFSRSRHGTPLKFKIELFLNDRLS